MSLHKIKPSGKTLFFITPLKSRESLKRLWKALSRCGVGLENCFPVYGYDVVWQGGSERITNYAIGCFPMFSKLVVVPLGQQESVSMVKAYSFKNIICVKQDGPIGWRLYVRGMQSPVTLFVPAAVPDIAESRGQFPIDQAEAADLFFQIMQLFPRKIS